MVDDIPVRMIYGGRTWKVIDAPTRLAARAGSMCIDTRTVGTFTGHTTEAARQPPYDSAVTMNRFVLAGCALLLLTGLTSCAAPINEAEPTETVTPPPTASPTPTSPIQTESSQPTATPAQTEVFTQRCLEVTADSFAGTLGDALTAHTEDLVTGIRPTDGYAAIYIPVTDNTPGLALSESAAACLFNTQDGTAVGYVATTPWSPQELNEFLAGTGPAAFRGGQGG